jgi:hypothetical protein
VRTHLSESCSQYEVVRNSNGSVVGQLIGPALSIEGFFNTSVAVCIARDVTIPICWIKYSVTDFVSIDGDGVLSAPLLVDTTSSLQDQISSISGTSGPGSTASRMQLARTSGAAPDGSELLTSVADDFYLGWSMSILGADWSVVETRTVVSYMGWNRTAVLNEPFHSVSSTGSSCSTSGGPAPTGTPCSFPFTYQGTEHHECIDSNNTGELWCGTQYGYDSAAGWGNCQCSATYSYELQAQGFSSLGQHVCGQIFVGATGSVSLYPVLRGAEQHDPFNNGSYTRDVLPYTAYAGEALCAQLNFSRIYMSYAEWYAQMNISWSVGQESGEFVGTRATTPGSSAAISDTPSQRLRRSTASGSASGQMPDATSDSPPNAQAWPPVSLKDAVKGPLSVLAKLRSSSTAPEAPRTAASTAHAPDTAAPEEMPQLPGEGAEHDDSADTTAEAFRPSSCPESESAAERKGQVLRLSGIRSDDSSESGPMLSSFPQGDAPDFAQAMPNVGATSSVFACTVTFPSAPAVRESKLMTELITGAYSATTLNMPVLLSTRLCLRLCLCFCMCACTYNRARECVHQQGHV